MAAIGNLLDSGRYVAARGGLHAHGYAVADAQNVDNPEEILANLGVLIPMLDNGAQPPLLAQVLQ